MRQRSNLRLSSIINELFAGWWRFECSHGRAGSVSLYREREPGEPGHALYGFLVVHSRPLFCLL